MKVLWIIPGDPDSKANMIFAKRTIPALEAQGLAIRVFHLTSRSDPWALIELWKQARRVIADFKPDLVHSQYGSITGLFTCALGLPSVITFRGSDVNRDPTLPWYRGPISWTCSQVAALCSVASIFVSEQLRKKVIVPGNRSACLSSPIDLEAFRPLSKQRCREELRLPLDEKIVSFVSVSGMRLKRPELARAVCRNLSRGARTVRFLEIKGQDPADIPVWLCASDCLLFTSINEGSPNAVREALSCGVPTVSVGVGDVERWLSMDPFSRVANSDSVDDLARAVEEVWDLPEPRRRRVDFSEITLEAHAKTLAALYKSVACRPLSGGSPDNTILP